MHPQPLHALAVPCEVPGTAEGDRNEETPSPAMPQAVLGQDLCTAQPLGSGWAMEQCHPSEHLWRPTLGQLGGSGLTDMCSP